MGGYTHYYPEFFADQRIKFRIPYHMAGEWIIRPNESGVAAPEATFLHNVDKPFEIHRALIRLTAFDDQDPPELVDVQPETLDKRIFLRIQDTAKNEALTKNRSLVATLVDAFTRTWEWDVPYTFVRQEGFQVLADALAFPTICIPDPADETPCDILPRIIGHVRIELAFQGYLIVLQPPSETR